MANNKIKTTINSVVTADRFGLNSLFNELMEIEEFRLLTQDKILEELFGTSGTKKLLKGILRFSFLIELVKIPKIETTKFESRWGRRLPENDPRRSSFEECLEIFKYSIEQLIKLTKNDKSKVETIISFLNKTQVAYEIPLDYKNRITDGRMHVDTNIDWYFGGSVKKVAKLRDLLLDPDKNSRYELFSRVYNKIQVKSYLTDRVLTGVHKTNREKRWETHPESVHFALRRTCQDIEYTLIKQIFSFKGIPADLTKIYNEVESSDSLEVPFRCPITLDPMLFQKFESELLSPVHGKSNFQVGHLNPLKSINGDETFGHTAKNISWISSDGNRIQGSLSLKETRALIQRIAGNYEKYL